MNKMPPAATCPDCGGRAALSLYGEVWCVVDCHLKTEAVAEPEGATGEWSLVLCHRTWAELTRPIDIGYINGRAEDYAQVLIDSRPYHLYRHPVYVKTDDIEGFISGTPFIKKDAVVLEGKHMQNVLGLKPKDIDLNDYAAAMFRMGRG